MPGKLGLEYNDGQDLMQQTILNACLKFTQFEIGTNFNGWIYTIMRNLFLDKCRADKRMRILELKESISGSETIKFVDKNIEKALNELPEKVRDPLMLRSKGYTYEEISQILNIKRNTIGAYIFEARTILKQKLNVELLPDNEDKNKAIDSLVGKQSKAAEIMSLFEGVVGRRVKIFSGADDSYWASADVHHYEHDQLYLKEIVFFNHNRKSSFIVKAENITRIEVIPET